MAALQHLQAVTLVDVQQCRLGCLTCVLPRVPLDSPLKIGALFCR